METLEIECGLFTKKFELYFKGSAASAPTHSPRHLYRSAFGLVKSRFEHTKKLRPIFLCKENAKILKNKTQMAALVVVNLSRLKLSRTAIKKDDLIKLTTITIYKFFKINTIAIDLPKISKKMYNKIIIMEKYLIYILAGFMGGTIRALVGFVKSKTIEKANHFKPEYFLISIAISGIVGVVAGILADTEWQVSFLAGYAGTDFIENLYKIKISRRFLG